MCITIWSTENQLGYRLILASNRDEFLHRPSLSAHFHSFEKLNEQVEPLTRQPSPPLPSFSPKDNQVDDHKHDINQKEILSGRDMIAGGTWLGVNHQTGKFGFLTNVNSQLDTALGDDDQDDCRHETSTRLSRGTIIQNFLKGNKGVDSYIAELRSNQSSKKMNGYNLVIGELGKTESEEDQFGFFCNRDPDGNNSDFDMLGNDNKNHQDSPDSRIVYGLSNGIAQRAPIWPKVTRGVHLLKECIDPKIPGDKSHVGGNQHELETSLFNMLSTTDDLSEEIPDNILVRPHHRVEIAGGQASSQTWYGTRTQTLLLVSRTTPTRITFLERDAFQIEPKDSSHGSFGKPLWLGDDRSRWRRFEINLPTRESLD